MRAAQDLAQRWPALDPAVQHGTLRQLLRRVDVDSKMVTLHLDPTQMLGLAHEVLAVPATGPSKHDEDRSDAGSSDGRSDAWPALLVPIPVELRRAGREMALVVGDQDAPAQRNATLVRLVVQAHALRDALLAGGDATLDMVAEREGITKSYLARLVRLAYLALSITEAILDGTQPATITPSRLMRDTRLPMDWQEQRHLLGI